MLLEAAPEGMTPDDVGWAMARAEHVSQVHDLHVWELAPGHPVLTAHVLVAPMRTATPFARSLELMLHERFEIAHTTLQVDHAQPELIKISRYRSTS